MARLIVLTGVMTAACVVAGCTPPDKVSVVDRLPAPLVQAPFRDPSPRVRRPPPPRPTTRTMAGVKIVVDAGHGGKDPGAQGVSRLPEKTIVLAIANELAQRLTARGAKVTRTRSSDQFIELDDRAAIADRTRTDLFLSIHANSASRRSAAGVVLYIARGALGDSQRAALSLNQTLRGAGIACRGVQRAGFRVLVGHSRPAILIETGFLTNPGEARKLNDPAYRARLADAIADGVAAHFRR